MAEASTDVNFWTYLDQSVDPTAYRPQRHEHIIVARLNNRSEPYYVLKEPLTRSYLRLSEADYALWWQMGGVKSIKDLLFYNLLRYRSLPIGHLTRLVADLRAGHFLKDRPTDLYTQVEQQLAARAPASRGRRLLDGFLHSEMAIDGLDDVFTPLYRRFNYLFAWPAQLILWLVIIGGGMLFGRLFLQQTFALSAGGEWSVLSLILANLLVIGIHELAHGLTTKHYGRELNRGGFLIYWGLPAFFVDTRDIWLSPRRARMAVSWAGPHSGLILAGLMGLALTAVVVYFPSSIDSLWTSFLYQVGFLAYLSVFINLNPLLELDGYFILMDWLEMPGLRERAFRFWRDRLWRQVRSNPYPRRFWASLTRTERVFALYGGLALVYSTYALLFALYFWQTRLLPLVERLWHEGLLGQLVILSVTAALVAPAIYYLVQYGWNRAQAGLEWLARRQLLARPDVLALLTGLPLFLGLPLLLVLLSTMLRADLLLTLMLWLLHLAAVAVLAGVARQVPGSRFQWALWSLVLAPVGMTLAWLSPAPLWRELSLVLSAAAVLATGLVAAFTVWPSYLQWGDKAMMAIMLALGLSYAGIISRLDTSRWPATALILPGIFAGLISMTPLLLNFRRSRFALPWFLLTLAILTLPWLQFYPALHLPAATLWLYAGLLYLLLGALAQFNRHTADLSETSVFNERKRLVDGFNHFMEAMFHSYEAVFGGRRLATIQEQMLALGPLDPDDGIFQIGERARKALLLAVDRLDDLAGTPFTRKAGQAAYDSLPWLEAETLARHVLASTEWGSRLAQGFIRSRDRRAELIRQADVFAGFDQAAVQAVLAIARPWQGRAGALMGRAEEEATCFYLIEEGEVGVFHEGEQMATLTAGGYFGALALLDGGTYLATFRALTPVRALVIDRHKFDPLLRADTTLAQQVSSGARERNLLKQMPLFSSLSPQQLATVDARLVQRRAATGEVIVRQGQPRSHLYIVANGIVEVTDENEAGVEVTGRLGPGEHFGEYALFADKPYQATYRAVVDTELLLLDEPKFDELVVECELMSHYVEQIGSGRLITTRRRLGLSAVFS